MLEIIYQNPCSISQDPCIIHYLPNLDLLGIGQNVFTMTRKEGHM